MLPVTLAAALVMLPPDETALRYSVWVKPQPESATKLLAEKLRVEARELRNAKKPADALPLFNAAVLLRPDDYTTRIGRAKTFAALGRYDEQADEYTGVLARYPGSPAVWCDVAEGWIARGKWDEAEKCFERAVELAPPGWRCQVMVQEAEYWLGEDQTADALKLLPAERMMRAHLALCEALELPQQVSDHARHTALALRAWVRFNRGWFAESATDYDELLVLMPSDARLHYQRGAIAYELMDYTKALRHTEAVEKHGGDLVLVAQARCKTLLVMEDYERAEAEALKWVGLAPTDQDAALHHAIALRLVGKDQEADRVTKSAAVLSARTFADQVYEEVHTLWVWYGEYDVIDRLLTRRIVNTDDKDELATAYCNRGELRRLRGLVEEALDDLTACMRLRPQNYTPEWFGQRWHSNAGDTTSPSKMPKPSRDCGPSPVRTISTDHTKVLVNRSLLTASLLNR